MKFKANFLCKPGNFQMDDCRIEKVLELSRDEFYNLKIIPLQDHAFIAENKRYMFCDEEAIHCLLALGPDNHDGILIESSGYNYPRYAAWDTCRKEVSEMIQLTSDMLMRMTARLPIRFSYVTLREGFPSCIDMSGFVSGTVKDAEAVKATELYKNMNQWHPEVTEWLASCSVYVGGNADSDCATDADAFDMSIISSDEYRFLRQPGIRHVETRKWNIPVYENIRALRIAPGQTPEIVTMPNTLEAFQKTVGGYIETVELDANAVLVCNEVGKLTDLPLNRQVGNDIIAGTFLIVGSDDGEFCSLSNTDAAHYAEQFAQPLLFYSEPEKPTQWEYYVL